MISILTDATIETLRDASVAASLAWMAVLVLLALLVLKVLVGGRRPGGQMERRPGGASLLDVGIAPLTLVFVLVVLVRIWEGLR